MSEKKTGVHPAWVLIAFVVLFGYIIWPKSNQKTVTATPSQTTPTLTAPAAPDFAGIATARKYHLRSLELAAAGHPEGDPIIRYYKEHIGYASILGPEQLGFNPIEAQTKEVMIVVSSFELRRKNRFPAVMNWQYENARRVIYAPPIENYTELWAGVRLAHEISHVLARRSGAMPENAPDLQWQKEEVRAHRFEHELLDGHTKGRYFAEIDAFITEDPGRPNAPTEWYRAPNETLFQRLQPLFSSSKGIHEDATRRGSLMVAMNERLAKKLGLSDEELAHAIDPKLSRPH